MKRRHYDEQFKRDAVALLEGGRGATQLARELGVSQWNLRDWKGIFGTGGAGAGRQARGAQPAVVMSAALEAMTKLKKINEDLDKLVEHAVSEGRNTSRVDRSLAQVKTMRSELGKILVG